MWIRDVYDIRQSTQLNESLDHTQNSNPILAGKIRPTYASKESWFVRIADALVVFASVPGEYDALSETFAVLCA